MNPLRLSVLVVVGCCLLNSKVLLAEETVSPFGANQQFSADMVITTPGGQTITQKIYSDSGKMRTEVTIHDMSVVNIVRPDQQKVYSVMEAQKMVMEMPYDPEKYKQLAMASSGPQGKFEVVGPDTVDGVACTKYKVTSKDGKAFFFWIDTARKAPVKMAAEDNSVTILWKNYKAGPQDAALFEVPAGYKVMIMPSMPGMPGGGMPGSGQ